MTNTEKIGLHWRGKAWADGEPVTRVSLPDGSVAEAMAALGYCWDASSGSFVKIPGDAVNGIKVQGSVTANAGSGPWPVTDNGGSLTVDAPVGTPVFVELSDGAVVWKGQKTMAASLPVVLPSDQTVTVSVSSLSGKSLKTASFSLAATGTVVSAVSTKRIKVYAVKLVVSAAISVNFRDGAASNLEGAQALAANSGYVEAVAPPAFLFASSASNTLDLVLSGSGTAAGRVSYWDDDTT